MEKIRRYGLLVIVLSVICCFCLGLIDLNRLDISKLNFTEVKTSAEVLGISSPVYDLGEITSAKLHYYSSNEEAFCVATNNVDVLSTVSLLNPIKPTFVNCLFKTKMFLGFWCSLGALILYLLVSVICLLFAAVSNLGYFCSNVELLFGNPALRIIDEDGNTSTETMWGESIEGLDNIPDEDDSFKQPGAPPFMAFDPERDSFNPTSCKMEKTGVSLKDICGIDEVRDDVSRVLDILKNKDAYLQAGARLPKGMILYGPPGTGKTMLAKAIATESDSAFYFCSGSDFIEKYVGVGAQRIRALYAEARKSAPSIVFIDEIDSIACERSQGKSEEHNQTINALLAELDSMNSGDGVFTIVATNRFSSLDSAFTREGRFDLKLAVTLPDLAGREELIKHYAANKTFYKGFSPLSLAKMTVGFSGAQLETLLNEAVLYSCHAGHSKVTEHDIQEAMFKVIMHGNKKRVKSKGKFYEENRILTAYHEAGHAVVAKMLVGEDVPFVTIVPSTSGAAGVTFLNPIEDDIPSKARLKQHLMVDYAGRAAEELLKRNRNDITAGASADIENATALIKRYIGTYGLGNSLVNISILNDKHDMVEEANKLASSVYEETLCYLRENWSYVEKLAKVLLEKECCFEKDITSCLALG